MFIETLILYCVGLTVIREFSVIMKKKTHYHKIVKSLRFSVGGRFRNNEYTVNAVKLSVRNLFIKFKLSSETLVSVFE